MAYQSLKNITPSFAILGFYSFLCHFQHSTDGVEEGFEDDGEGSENEGQLQRNTMGFGSRGINALLEYYFRRTACQNPSLQGK